jgi:polyhydroxyalkanoate synthase
MFNWMNETFAAAMKVQQANIKAMTRNMELSAAAVAKMWGDPAKEVMPPDRRFKDEAWQDNLAADILKQSYLITSQWLLDLADGLETVDPDLHRRNKFWVQQYVDSISPTNFVWTNPVVWQEMVRTGGQSLATGMQNLFKDARAGRVSQVPEGSFEVGRDLAITAGKVIYRNALIELIQYSPSTDKVHETPILIVPPWINKYYVMDMQPHNSMFKYLVDAGFTLFTISWKNPDESTIELGWDDYMDLGPLQALKIVREVTGQEQINLVGYCLGGIISQVTLAYLAANGDDSVRSATYLTTHQDFKQAGDIVVFISEADVLFLEWLMNVSGGYLDGRNMAATFNMLRANDLLWSYIVSNYLLGKEPPAFDLLYWNSDGTRVPARVHSYLLREFFLANKLMQPGAAQAKGVGIDLGRITTPTYVVAAQRDHIVPWQGAFLVRQLQGGPVRFILSGGGHIAGIINPPAAKKRNYWINQDEKKDSEAWLAAATKHAGSWWQDWVPWLVERSGGQVDPPPMGSENYAPIMDAPGTYVLEK